MKRVVCLIICLCVLTSVPLLSATAKVVDSTSATRFANPGAKPTIALALGGGGMRGIAHIGVLRVLERENIPVDCIAGSSIGALVGGMYAAGLSPDQIEEIFRDNHLKKIVGVNRLGWAAIKKSMQRVILRKHYSGLIGDKKFSRFMKKYMPEDKTIIEDLNIPFCVVVTNLRDGKAYRLTTGDITQAIFASMAMAPLLKPVKVNGDVFVDGGVSANVPTIAAKQFNPSLVLAVSVDEHLRDVPEEEFGRVSTIVNRVASIVLSRTDAYHLEKADVQITPDVSGIAILSDDPEDFDRAIEAGEAAAEKALPKIRQALASAGKARIQSAQKRSVIK